jgi:hypothetical protein
VGLFREEEKNPMNEDTVVRVQMLSPNDTPSISTILEEMFQFFDASVGCGRYTTIEKQTRLRLALLAFGEAGYAQLGMTIKAMPMVVPTAKLLNLLELTSLTTDLEPLTLLPVRRCIPQPEARRHFQYTRAFKSAMAKEMDKFLNIPTATLNMWERGLLRHSRKPNGDLVWSNIENSGKGRQDLGAGAGDTESVPGPTIRKDLELEFEIDSENILLLCGDDLPVRREVLEVLQISHKELEALFKTAAKLLGKTNPDDRMRAYAAQGSTQKWQVELLLP